MKKEVILDWYTDYDSNKDKNELIICHFKTQYDNERIKELLKEAYEFLNRHSGFELSKEELNNIFTLRIRGRGHDYRCLWCRQFRTRLRNLLKENGMKLQQSKVCRFDKEEGYGLDPSEERRKKIKKYEEGLDEESSEEDYERWKSALRIIEGES